MDEGHEADGSFGVTGGDGAVVFEFTEESFDAVAVFVLAFVVVALIDPSATRRDLRSDLLVLQGFDEGIGVVAAISEELRAFRHGRQQC